MLAQNFMTAAELGLEPAQRDALVAVLGMLERGELVHVRPSREELPGTALRISGPRIGQFNMLYWASDTDCGTVHCIGGAAEVVGHLETYSLDRAANARYGTPLYRLLYGRTVDGRCLPHDIYDCTPAQAALALRSYLTVGEAHWELAVAVPVHPSPERGS